jgi:hypothetical protein
VVKCSTTNLSNARFVVKCKLGGSKDGFDVFGDDEISSENISNTAALRF